MKTLLTLLISLFSISTYSQIYIDPSAKTNGNGTIESPYNYISSFRANTIHYIKCGTTFNYNRAIKNDSVGIRSYGTGDRPKTKSNFVFLSKNLDIRGIEFSDTSKTDLVIISGGGNCFISNCFFNAKSRPLTIDSISNLTIFGGIIKSAGDGLIINKVNEVTLYGLRYFGCEMNESAIFTNIGYLKETGITQDPSEDRELIKSAIKLLNNE